MKTVVKHFICGNKGISVMAALVGLSLAARAEEAPRQQAHFTAFHDFSSFTTEASTNPLEKIIVSPVIKSPLAWDQLIASWNADAPSNAWLKIEVRCLYPGHTTKYYTMGLWSMNAPAMPRMSVRRQGDDDGTVHEDTLEMKRPGADAQLRLTLGQAAGGAPPRVRLAGLCFSDSRATPAPAEPDRAVWGKIIPTPELSQDSYPQEKGWCSPTSIAMVLARWGDELHRAELHPDVPEVAANVFDTGARATGNWPFNTAYAGSFPGIRAYVTRFSDMSELETWIAAGIPVIISAPWDLLQPGRKHTGNGHLSVVIGFTSEGDVVINDPGTNLQKGQHIRHIFKRADVINAWKMSHNTVYLVYPETTRPPADPRGHWDDL